MTHRLLSREVQVFAILALTACLAWVAYLIRHRRLSLRDSLLWLLSTAVVLVLVLFPGLLAWGAAALGVEVPSNALFAVAIFYLAANLLSTTIALSNGAARLRTLTQECALLRGEIDLLQARLELLDGGGADHAHPDDLAASAELPAQPAVHARSSR